MKVIKKNDLIFFQYELLQKQSQVIHGSFTRYGGLSLFPFDSLNVGFEIGDQNETVQKNQELISNALGLKKLLHGKQIHGSTIHIIKDLNENIPPCDALITRLTSVGLLIKHADCQAALIYDPKNQVIGNVHAGWRGSIQKIYTKTILKMYETFGSLAEDLLITISPSLGPDDAEFINYKEELPLSFLPYQVKPSYFDFWKISKQELLEAGVLESNIEIAKISTFSNKDFFHLDATKTVEGVPQ